MFDFLMGIIPAIVLILFNWHDKEYEEIDIEKIKAEKVDFGYIELFDQDFD